MKTKIFKSLLLGVLILSGIQTLQAQEYRYTRPSWWFGAAAGANFNFYRGTTQTLNSTFVTPTAFHNGFGAGLYLGTMLEYHAPETKLGFILQLSYDGRNGKFNEVMSPCNCPADLTTNLNYFAIEPSLRLAPFRGNFYLFAGPRLSYNWKKDFLYEQGINPDFPEQTPRADVEGEFSDINKLRLSMQVGMGMDIQLSSKDNQAQTVLSPFVSFLPYFGQNPRSVESWNMTTIRVGAALKFGRGRKAPREEVAYYAPPKVVIVEPKVSFSVTSPKNVPEKRRVRETFPLLNYIFFNLESTEIPNRYVLLKKDEVKDFHEDQLDVVTPKDLSGRSGRSMVVYYNVLNILGDRMVSNTGTDIVLVGSSELGPEDGRLMATSVKNYLVDIYGISPSRIKIEGRFKPKLPSEQPGGTLELTLLREGDRRVSIESSSPDLIMEFQSGPAFPLRPVEFYAEQEAPLDSYVTFHAEGANLALKSWSVEVMDENGEVQFFGPYIQDRVSVPGKAILGDRPKGNFRVTMIGQTISGKTIKEEVPVQVVLWAQPVIEEGLRFSVIFEFGESKAIQIYERYLADFVTPKIPRGAKVMIHGYTDIIGDEQFNLELSFARANAVKGIIEDALAKSGRSDVTFEVYGFGEDTNRSQFGNKYPEERFYNRTVIIDIIPQTPGM
jgi:outer membrane protein OmpA-like peptidoglycan-associated protein